MKRVLHRYLMRERSPKLIIGGLIVCAIIVLSACQKAEPKPLEIATGDLCLRCKMAITEKQYAAEFVTKDGFVRKFDDIGCMLQHAQSKGFKGNIVAYFIVDYPSKKWMKADEGSYVKSEKFQTPMNGGILAFKDKTQAEKLATTYQAQFLTFDQLVK
jgi:copper chaperone NosL